MVVTDKGLRSLYLNKRDSVICSRWLISVTRLLVVAVNDYVFNESWLLLILRSVKWVHCWIVCLKIISISVVTIFLTSASLRVHIWWGARRYLLHVVLRWSAGSSEKLCDASCIQCCRWNADQLSDVHWWRWSQRVSCLLQCTLHSLCLWILLLTETFVRL